MYSLKYYKKNRYYSILMNCFFYLISETLKFDERLNR